MSASSNNPPSFLPEDAFERLMDGERMDTLDPAMATLLQEHPAGRSLTANVEMAQWMDAHRLREPALAPERQAQLWQTIENRIDLIEHDQSFAKVISENFWDRLRETWTDFKGACFALFRPDVCPVRRVPSEISAELLHRGYPMTSEQRSTLAQILEEQGLFASWWRRRRIVRTLRWSLASLALFVLAGGIGTWVGKNRTLEQLPSFKIAGGIAEMNDGVVSTSKKDGGLFHLGSFASGAISPDARMQLKSDRRIALERGSVWLDVDPQGQGFVVETEFGPVVVKGTSFGVTLTDNGVNVDVARGQVAVGEWFDHKVVAAGQRITADHNGLQPVEPRKEQSQKPRWVVELETRDEVHAYDDRLLAYWDMEDVDTSNGGFVLRNVAGDGLDLSAAEASPQARTSSLDPQICGQMLRFTRNSKSCLDIADAPELNKLTRNFTMMAWVRLTSDIKGQCMIGSARILQGNKEDGWRMGFNERRMWWTYDLKCETVQLPLNRWAHVAVTVDPSGQWVSFYMNGKLAERKKMPYPLNPIDGAGFALGAGYVRNQTHVNHFEGEVDEVRIYNAELTADEIGIISRVDLLKSAQQSKKPPKRRR